MNLTAVLCWYDEPVEMLDRCVRSLAGVVDQLVAVDGRFEPFPGDSAVSSMDQAIALRKAAREFGIPLREHAPCRPWPSQIAKRDHAMMFARDHGADWLLVIDADEYMRDELLRGARRFALMQELGRTESHVATVTLRNVVGDDFYMVEQPRRRIFRAGTRVEESHQGYTYDGVPLDGDTRFGLKRAEALDVRPLVMLEHTPRSRGEERNAAAKRYRHLRSLAGEL